MTTVSRNVAWGSRCSRKDTGEAPASTSRQYLSGSAIRPPVIGQFVTLESCRRTARCRDLIHGQHLILVGQLQPPLPMLLEEGSGVLDTQLIDRQVLRGVLDGLGQRGVPACRGLSRQSVHEIQADRIDPRPVRCLDRPSGLACVMGAPEYSQFRIVERLDADGQTIDPALLQSFDITADERLGIGLKGDFGITIKTEHLGTGGENLIEQCIIQNRGSPAADKERAERPPQGHRRCLYLPHHGPAIPGVQVVVAGHRGKRTVTAFAGAERDVQVEAGHRDARRSLV